MAPKIAYRISTVRDCGVIRVVKGSRIVAKEAYGGLVRASPDFEALAGLECTVSVAVS